MKITYAIGPYPSRRAQGYVIIVDTVGYPRKCPYNCIYCPLPPTQVKTLRPEAMINYEAILSDFKSIIERIGEGVKAILLYGTGDPLLNPWIPMIVDGIKRILRDSGVDAELWCITTGYMLGKEWVRKAVRLMDRVYVKVDAVSKDTFMEINDPISGVSPWKLAEIIKSLVSRGGPIIYVETTLIEYNGMTNADPGCLSEVYAFANMARVERILLRTINRPPRVRGVKPVSKKIIEKALELGEREGLHTEALQPHLNISYCRGVVVDEELLYNYLLRRPMTVVELSRAFSIPVTPITKLVTRLESMRLLERIPWRMGVYYRGVYRRTLF